MLALLCSMSLRQSCTGHGSVPETLQRERKVSICLSRSLRLYQRIRMHFWRLRVWYEVSDCVTATRGYMGSLIGPETQQQGHYLHLDQRFYKSVSSPYLWCRMSKLSEPPEILKEGCIDADWTRQILHGFGIKLLSGPETLQQDYKSL